MLMEYTDEFVTVLDLSHSWETMVQNIQNYISSLNDSYLEQLKENKITYFNAKASLMDKHTVRVSEVNSCSNNIMI